MKIASISHVLPTTALSNDDAIELFRKNSRPHLSEADWAEIERRLRFYLQMSGVTSRRIALNGEASLDLAITAADQALEAAGAGAGDIDLIIYASVSRGWLEPSMAVAVQNRLNADNATSFDILDACAGWLRAMHVASALLKSGTYRRILILNLESGMLDFIRFDLKRVEDIQRYGAAATLGNAATATLLESSDDDDFYFNIKTFSDDLELCFMPLENAGNFQSEVVGEDLVPGKFMANSTRLLAKTASHMAEVFKQDSHLADQRYDIIFSHAVGNRVNRTVAQETGVSQALHFTTHETFGNTASASVPLAMSLALEEGKLVRGNRVGILVGSAGITVGFATFTY